MSLQNYERMHNDDEMPRFQEGGVSGNCPPYTQAMPHTGHASGNYPPYSQPITQAGPQYGQASPQHTTATTVFVQQPRATNFVRRSAPNDFIVWSIFGCLCCLCPIGLCAIAASCDSRNKAGNGDMEGAKSSSRCALGLNIFNTILGLIMFTVIIILYSQASALNTKQIL